jgi:hypothetical protein
MLNSFRKKFMGLAGKKNVEKPAPTGNLTKAEIEFVLKKLRTADYKGSEFETFFNVFNKLTQELQK